MDGYSSLAGVNGKSSPGQGCTYNGNNCNAVYHNDRGLLSPSLIYLPSFIMKFDNTTVRVGGVHGWLVERQMCGGNNQTREST